MKGLHKKKKTKRKENAQYLSMCIAHRVCNEVRCCPFPTNRRTPSHTIWGGSVSTGEERPLHFGALNHALSHVGGPTQSQLSRPMFSGHHISMEDRLRRKHLWLDCDTPARNETCLKERQEKRKKLKLFVLRKTKK